MDEGISVDAWPGFWPAPSRSGDVGLVKSRPVFLRPQHPKSEIRPTREAIARILSLGWAGQLKIHGHRAQIHIPALEGDCVAFNRKGGVHRKLLPPAIQKELRRIFAPASGWTVIDAEWIKDENKLFVFDVLKKDGESQAQLNYEERYKALPRDFLSPNVRVLPLLKTIEKCLSELERPEAWIEGLVFKSLATPGFQDTSIVRCRRPARA